MEPPKILFAPGGGEFGWYDRDLSFEGAKEWIRRGFDPTKKPTREEILNRDLKWEHDLNQWVHILRWIEDTEALQEEWGMKPSSAL